MTTSTTSLPVRTRRSGLAAAAAVWSGIVAFAGAWWLASPDSYPRYWADGGEESGSLVALLDPTVGAGLLLALGAVGVLAALRASTLGGGTSVPVGVLGVAYGAAFALLVTDMTLLVVMGYSTAIFGPPVLFGILVTASAYRPRLRWLVGGVVAVAAVLTVTFGVDLDALAEFGGELTDGLARAADRMLLGLTAFLGGTLWLLLGLRALGLGRAVKDAEPSYVRPARDWGWWVTVLAAVGPLPYALTRMTWLTPWPFWLSAEQLEAHPATRIFGLSLGFAAIGGSVLTAGLLLRWGSVYPAWMPGVGGRSVSPTWPTVLALVVGAAITVAGRSTAQVALQGDALPLAALDTQLILPFWAWGPLLIAAAIAYYRRRTNEFLPGPRSAS
jgi:hypothetical protein